MLIEYSAKRMWRQQALLHVLVCLSSILLNLYLLQIMLGPLSNPCNKSQHPSHFHRLQKCRMSFVHLCSIQFRFYHQIYSLLLRILDEAFELLCSSPKENRCQHRAPMAKPF